MVRFDREVLEVVSAHKCLECFIHSLNIYLLLNGRRLPWDLERIRPIIL